MYKKELKKMEIRELKKTRTGLERMRNAAQKVMDDTYGSVSTKGGRTELKKILRFAERSLNKVEEMISEKERKAAAEPYSLRRLRAAQTKKKKRR